MVEGVGASSCVHRIIWVVHRLCGLHPPWKILVGFRHAICLSCTLISGYRG